MNSITPIPRGFNIKVNSVKLMYIFQNQCINASSVFSIFKSILLLGIDQSTEYVTKLTSERHVYQNCKFHDPCDMAWPY